MSMADGLVVRARSVEERPTNVPVTMELLNTITGAPWQPTSTLCDAQPLDVRTPDGQQEANPEVEEVPEKAPARVYISKTVLKKVGYSDRCKKCTAMNANDKQKTKNNHHTDECRERVEAAMMQDPKLKRSAVDAENRQNEWLAKQLEDRDEGSAPNPPGAAALGGERAESQREEPSGSGHADGEEDYWVLEETEVVRVHVKPRLTLFTPIGKGCPVEMTEVAEGRSTFVRFIESGEETLIIDNWTVEANSFKRLEGLWKGLTRFTRVETRPASAVSNAPPGPNGPSNMSRYRCRGGLPRAPEMGRPDTEAPLGRVGQDLVPRYDVAELYSPSRITRLAAKRGMRAGWNFDYQHEDPLTGRRYDFLKKADRVETKRLLEEEGVEVLTVSPPCTVFSNLQHMDPVGVTAVEWNEACRKLDHSVEICKSRWRWSEVSSSSIR